MYLISAEISVLISQLPMLLFIKKGMIICVKYDMTMTVLQLMHNEENYNFFKKS